MKNLYIRKLNEDDLNKMIKVAEDKYKYGEMSKEKYLKWLNAKQTNFFEEYLEAIKKREFGQGEEAVCIIGNSRGNEVQQIYCCSQLIKKIPY